MLKHAADLSDTYEYFIVWAGGTNARPWGAKADAYSLFPEFELAADGMDILAALNGSDTGFEIAIGITESIEKNEWAGSTIRVGANDAPLVGYGTVQRNDAIDAGSLTGDIVVTWTIAPTATASTACYFVREGRKWGYYPQVRVLTPYQNVTNDDDTDDAIVQLDSGEAFADDGRAVTLPSPYANPATTIENTGLLMPFTFFEGLDGFGISDASDSRAAGAAAHLITVISTNTWTFGATNALPYTGLLTGGYVMVDWEVGGVMKRSWAPITSSTTTTFNAGTWLGDGDPATVSYVKRYTAWVPHYNDSPYAYIPGEGFTYPNSDMMPCAGSAIGANVHNRPRGLDGNAYGDAFGAMLVAASRLSSATGRRVNVVNLGVTDATLAPSNERNPYGFDGTLGWWNHESHGTWAPNVSTSLYARLDKLLRTVLPNAMTAESNSKSLRCLGIVFTHGDDDAVQVHSRQHYGKAQKLFVTVLRKLIDTLGYNPYDNGAEIPYVQPRIALLPYGIDGTYDRDDDRGGGTLAYDGDTLTLVNSAIEEIAVSDEFAESVRVDDLPRLSTDPGIYSGAGEAELGSRIGDTLSLLVDHSLGFGSTVMSTAQTKTIDICNLALANIGDASQITSLNDGSEQAILCKRFLPDARDELLQMRQWGFALRRRQLVAIQKPEPRLFQNWEYCYVVPADALFSFNVVGPLFEPTVADFDYEEVTTAAYQTTFIENDGGSIPIDSTATLPVAIEPGSPTGAGGVVVGVARRLPILTDIELDPQAYAVEQSPFGHRYIFTNQAQATVQYVARVVDADQYSSPFSSALAANLGAKLASVIIKGDEGEAVSARMLQKTAGYVRMASTSDANQKRPSEAHRPFGFQPDHMRHRQ